MNSKFLIVIFVIIFCNGVSNSPVNETTSELISKEKQTVSPVASNKTVKVENTTASPESTIHRHENSTFKTSTHIVEVDGEKISSNNSTAVDTKPQGNGQGFGTKKETSNVNTVTIKGPSIIMNASKPVVANSSSQINVSTSAPAIVSSNSPSVPVDKITTDLGPENSEMPRPVPTGQSTATVTTPNAGKITKAPVTVTTVVTSAPSTQGGNDSVKVEHNSAPQNQGSRFDNASFIGGIVLTIGLTAIGFIAFKYYKSGKIDANYRTL